MTRRSRQWESNEEIVYGSEYFAYPQTSYIPSPSLPRPFHRSVGREFINSVDTRPANKRVINPVFHYSYEKSSQPIMSIWTPSFGTRFARYDFRFLNPEEIPAMPPGSRPIVDYVPDLDSMVKDAESSFVPDFNPVTTLLEPLDPLKRISKLGPALGKRPPVPIRKKKKKKKKFDFKKALTEEAEAFNPLPDLSSPESAVLSYNLNTAPFISDAKAIWDRLFDWDRIIDTYDSAAKRGIRKVTSKTFTASGRHNYPDGSYVLFTTSLRVVWGVRFTGRVTSGLKDALRRFAPKIDLGVAWEFVPLSFLVDYVIPVGSALSRYTPQLSNFRIDQMWVSEKLVSSSTYYTIVPTFVWTDDGYVAQGPPKHVCAGTSYYKEYSRRPESWGSLDGQALEPPSIDLSNSQLANVAALARSFQKKK